jgi:hypothetical protein
MLENNNLIPAWEEFKAVKEIIKEGDEIKNFEKAGKVRVKIVNAKQRHAVVDIFIPPMYPRELVKLKLVETTIDPLIAKIFMIEADEIAKKCHSGVATGERPKAEKRKDKQQIRNEEFE